MTSEDNTFNFNFDDDIFGETKEKQQVELSTIDYQAKVETDGWFHSDKSIEELMLETHGPNQLKNSIEHDYLYKRYDIALDKCLEYIRVARTNDQCKVSGTKELVEMAMHCAAKLNKLDIINKLLDEKQSTVDTGLLLTRGKFLPLVGRYKEAMHTYIEYHKERKLDYKVWNAMANVFMLSAENDSEKRQDMRYHLANLSMIRAIHIYTNSRWRNKIDFVKNRFEKELKSLEARLEITKERQGDADKFVEWMSTDDKSIEDAGLSSFDWQDIIWIYKDWILRQDIEVEEDNTIKAVKDL
ncbi:hypothetical protein G6F70_002998 [Rhizopus microsporus]|uniref:Uncharacterized protein n=1 Tax=Rhizopus azygosporus TaxID=86630 RepID=A0A367KBR8_RHIAZ|nr:hypothetical protein G6F71_000469 [Rhizopus microsporus]RCH99616.1 hypothetical protein CU097_015391 [Rhizopus azygosporus]KAG1201610.1 hypothetical protein G6F70_002998 [Rhizopus microsporus]KAG1215533.1 hypothetical protein G6F69_000890 [Rhizopus microsporus]KAG1238787.1 hypothetical protein G6F67_000136 [Rhizopus microsporus]